MVKVLFVCMGNICRSPAGEGIFKEFVKRENLQEQILIDSAGTIGYHVGEPADHRMRQHARERGYSLDSLSRQILPEDLKHFDYILVADRSNYANVLLLDEKEKYKEKVMMMTDFCRNRVEKEVPDPYYGGHQGFETVLDILEDACEGLLEDIREKHL